MAGSVRSLVEHLPSKYCGFHPQNYQPPHQKQKPKTKPNHTKPKINQGILTIDFIPVTRMLGK
jgi:hypothetical protein